MNCPDPSVLAAYAEGRLAPDADLRVTKHVRGCAACTRALRDFASRAATAVARSLAVSEPHAEGPPVALPERGTAIGRYLVLGTVGEGGMGLVLSAYDPELNRRVALKLLRVELDATDQAEALRERLRREAQVMARLSHPNVVAVYDVGPYGAGIYLAMEWVDGSDLWHWQQSAPHPAREVLARYLLAGEGLAAAHRAGVVHRDFKPENVLVGTDGRVRVTDFGLAQKARSEVEEKELTGPGAVVGTPGYIAPEQLKGLEVDGRADQFSFCAALYEALYGRQPFAGGKDTAILAKAVLDGKLRAPLPTPSVPKYLWPVLQRGLANDAAARYPSMEDLLHALRADPQARTQRAALIAFGVVLILAAGGAVRALVARDGHRCQAAAEAALSSWSPERRERIGVHQRSEGSPGAAEDWKVTSAQIERYAGEWIQARTEVCEAERASGDSADLNRQDALRRQEACLTDLRRDLDEALSDLESSEPGHADAPRTGVGPELIAHLDPPGSCHSMRGATHSEGDDDETLWRNLAHVRVLFDEDRFTEAEPLMRPLIEAARNRQARVVLARALRLEARLGRELGRDGAALEAELQDAARAGEAAGDDPLVADARLLLLRSVSMHPPPLEEQAAWTARLAALRADADAAVLRAGDTVDLRARQLWTYGNLDTDLGDPARALPELEEALALTRQVPGDDLNTANILSDLGGSYEETGDYPRAQRVLQEALVLERSLLGPDHVETATIEVTLGWLDALAGHPELALPRMEHGVKVFAGLRDAASNSYHAWALVNQGQVLVELGRFDEGVALLNEAKSIYDGEESPEPTETAGLRTTLAEVELRRGQLPEAAAHVERALADLQPRRGFRRELAEAEFLMAQVLTAQGKDPTRAAQLAESARRRFAAAVNGDGAQLAEVTAWQNAHPAPAPARSR